MKLPAIVLTAVFSFLFLILTVAEKAHVQAQATGVPNLMALASGGGGMDLPADVLSDTERQAIQAQIDLNVARLTTEGAFAMDADTAVALSWPLSATNGLDDYGYHGISGFVDHDSRYGYLEDYTCGDRTYDLSGYNHKGTDFFTWPFAWNKMDNDEVSVVAAAPGTIVYKQDGHDDRSCDIDSGGSWNAVYVRHADNSVAWYGHLKNGSLTSKGVGDTVTTGEVLGVVGSSGNSTGPHLHLELYDSGANLVDPYADQCNPIVSWWQAQRPYYDTAVNKVMTGSAPVQWTECPNQTITNEQTEFSGGDIVYFTTFYRDQRAGQVSQYTIYQPDNSIFYDWTHSSTADHYAASWWWWSFALPSNAMSGMWRFEVVFAGQTYQTSFTVDQYITVSPFTGGVFWLPGSTRTIDWQDNIASDVSIDLLHGGVYSETIAAAVPSSGHFDWTVPVSSTIGLGYQVRVMSVADTAVFSTSQPFAIGSRDQFNNLFLPLALNP